MGRDKETKGRSEGKEGRAEGMEGDSKERAKVDIIVCTVNLLEYTKTAFETLYKNEPEPFHLVVVDICSTDGTQDWLKTFADEKGNVTLILKTEKDKGFAEGFNSGLEKCITPFIGSYHSDMILTKSGWIRHALPLFEDPKVAYIGSKLLYPSGNIQHAGASFNSSTMEWYHLGYKQPDGKIWSRIFEVPGVTGAGSITRRSAIPEGLPTLYERAEYSDVELSCQLRRNGYRILYNGNIVFYHSENLSKKNWDWEKLRQRYAGHLSTLKSRHATFLRKEIENNPKLYFKPFELSQPGMEYIPTVTAITGAKDRIDNLPLLVKRLEAQTIKPTKIIVWHDYGMKKEDIKFPGVTCINCTDGEWQSFPQFVMAWLQNTDYVAVIDDDRPPGPRWFEYCIEMEKKQPGIYGCFGYRIKDPDNVYSRLELKKPDLSPWDDSVNEVDMVGQTYFFPTEYIKYFFMEKPKTWICVDDLHLAYTCSKYGKVRSFTLHPSDPEKRPCLNKQECPLNEWTFAEHQHPDHRKNRTEYVKWAVANGWKLKFVEE
jgi:GT2 family glycosyltransferase